MLLTRLTSWALVLGLPSCRATDRADMKRDMDSIQSKYDYIVVGGGTSGLVVANRLGEDPKKNVLVIEYGDFANTINATVPYFTTQDQSPRLYNMTSVPQIGLDNRVTKLRIGKVVGGGSTVNGMAWDRSSSVDYDAWEELGNRGWRWDTLVKYFRKSSQFLPPSKEYVEKYGYQWDADAYGEGPVKVGFPSWQWPEAKFQAQAWSKDFKARVLKDGADGTNVGLAWLPQDSGGKEATRSSAETAYYHPVKHRPNLHLLVRHYGATLQLHGNKATGVHIRSRGDGKKSRLVSAKEIILAAGTVNTPRILQLSGIGPGKLLESLGIDVVVNAPGVGANFQDHPSFLIYYKFKNDTRINSNLMNDPAFYDKSWKEWISNKTGPFTHAWGNRIVMTPLQDLDPKFESIAAAVEKDKQTAHLPAMYTDYPALATGYLRQQSVIQSQLRSSQVGAAEFAFGGLSGFQAALMKPLSRGTILINSTDPDPSIPPLIDFRTATHPVDMLTAIRAFRKARQMMATESMASLQPVELVPGPNVTSDEEIEKVMRESLLLPSFDHPIGTAAMTPREHGGVVDNSLRVYGVKGLWVVDASVIPILPATHTQATVYALAEYAADLIKGEVKNN